MQLVATAAQIDAVADSDRAVVGAADGIGLGDEACHKQACCSIMGSRKINRKSTSLQC